MTNPWLQFVPNHIQTLTPYTPGKPIETLERELGIQNSIKLASNENPLGPSPRVTARINEHINGCARYPDADGYFLKEALSEYHKLEQDYFTLGNGSDELFRLIGQTFLQPDDEVVVSEYCFAAYPITTKANNGKLIVVPTKNWRTDIDGFIAAANQNTRLIFIANPNNPTGTYVSHQQIENLLESIPKHIVVVLDEAYYDYNQKPDYPDSSVLQKKYQNLIVTRTFSKAYGLGGLRVGYAIADPEFGGLFNRIRLPFNVNLLAQAAAIAALSDREHVEKSVTINQTERDRLQREFKSLNLEFIPTIGNFITVDFSDNAYQIYEQLLTQGIIVRPLLNYNMPKHLRITVGVPAENDRMLGALQKLMR